MAENFKVKNTGNSRGDHRSSAASYWKQVFSRENPNHKTQLTVKPYANLQYVLGMNPYRVTHRFVNT